MMMPYIILTISNPDERDFMVQLYHSYKRLMYSEISKITVNSWDTEDVLHSVIVKLIKRVDYLQTLPESRLINYIISASKNTALNHIRDQKRGATQSFEDTFDDYEDQAPQLDDRLQFQELKSDAITALKSLDEKSRRVLEMKYILDLPDEEIASALGIKPESVRMTLTRARNKLKDELKKSGAL